MPVKPVLMAEGAYEQGSEYGFDVTALWIRRQAYYSYLAGGRHTYGHNDSWRVLPTWKEALYAPGAVQMGILKKIFLSRKEWWYLVPDQSIFASGGNVNGEVLNLAARHKDGKWVMVYLGSKSSFSINMSKITVAKKVNVFWIDPKTGDSVAAGSFPNTGVKTFSTPDEWEDALLILEPVDTHNGLIGAWLIVETTVTTPTGTTTNENPQPGVYIFTERHFSNMLIPNAEGRSPFTEERTDEERLAAYDNFIADSGSYELTDSLLTTHNIIAKVPNAMNGGFPYRYSLEGDSLVLTFDRGWAPPAGEITYRLVRLE